MLIFQDVSDLDYIFLQLQLQYRTDLHERNSLIIFDEVQLGPLARQAIKTLVKDHRYDYVETGSLISEMKDSKTVLVACHANDPDAGLSNCKDLSRFKLFLADTGLFTTLAFIRPMHLLTHFRKNTLTGSCSDT